MNAITIGLGWGDEGKGLITDYLCHPNSIVVRFSGGHQAGHTVVRDGKRHVFSNFGSGTLKGCKTFWSKYCTFHPNGVANEYAALIELYPNRIPKMHPQLYVDSLAPVTTFYDVFYNQARESMNQHGSCGVGVAATVERNETPYKLLAQDIFFPKIMQQKLYAIKDYYDKKILAERLSHAWERFNFDAAEERFLFACANVSRFIHVIPEKYFFSMYNHSDFVFEGSQGILLDMDFGIFPNVTRSNTTSKNALEIIHRNRLQLPDIYYITRSYQTRHGNGWMSDESLTLDTPLETNKMHEWQGKFRTGKLDIDLLNYALVSDHNFSCGLTKNLAVTCLDQVPLNVEDLIGNLHFEFDKTIESYFDCSDKITKPQTA